MRLPSFTRAPASSSTSIALSGRNRSVMYRFDWYTDARIASSSKRTPWKRSYRSLTPSRIAIVSDSSGGRMVIGWNRLTSARSFSMYLW